jgi:hypothetical protein
MLGGVSMRGLISARHLFVTIAATLLFERILAFLS